MQGLTFTGLGGRPLGVLDNAKTNAAQLLRAVVERLSGPLGVGATVWRDKRETPTALASLPVIRDLAQCGLIVSGLGS